MAIEITDEMRRAVLDEMCATKGHVFNVNKALGRGDQGQYIIDVRGPSDDELPHITCSRCTKVWVVVEVPGESYEEAETSFLDQLKANTPIAKKTKERRDRRGKK